MFSVVVVVVVVMVWLLGVVAMVVLVEVWPGDRQEQCCHVFLAASRRCLLSLVGLGDLPLEGGDGRVLAVALVDGQQLRKREREGVSLDGIRVR